MSGESMSPVLHPGTLLLCGWPNPRVSRGDLVVFPHPRHTGMKLVKRVVGLAGETVTIDTGEVAIDGVTDVDAWAVGLTVEDGTWPVPPGHAFVLSDNRKATKDDSRSFGPVPLVSARKVWGRLPGRPR